MSTIAQIRNPGRPLFRSARPAPSVTTPPRIEGRLTLASLKPRPEPALEPPPLPEVSAAPARAVTEPSDVAKIAPAEDARHQQQVPPGAEAEPKAVPTFGKPAKKAKSTRPPDRERMKQRFRQVVEARWPELFPPEGERVPLAVGIHKDIAARTRGRLDEESVSVGLGAWVKDGAYWHVLARSEGLPRFGFASDAEWQAGGPAIVPVGVVSEHEAKGPRLWLERLRAKTAALAQPASNAAQGDGTSR